MPCHLAILLLGSVAADPALVRFSYTEPHMGTRFRIVLYATDEKKAKEAAQAAFARIAELDAIMSDYRPTSELTQLSARAVEAPVPVSDDLFRVLKQSQELARQTDGAFDVTVGPLSRLWRITRRTQRLPDAETLAQARALVGYHKLRLDDKARTVQLMVKGMQLDLGGIAKGYAADAALAVLRQRGWPRALVAAGGDVVAGEPPPGTQAWTVGIAPLEDPDRPPTRFLHLRNAAVSTSGDAEQYVEIAGQRYSHILDPRTGLGLVGRSSVTVVAPDATTSDSLATAVSVLGPERGLKLIEAHDRTAVLIIRKTDKGEEVISSRCWKEVGR